MLDKWKDLLFIVNAGQKEKLSLWKHLLCKFNIQICLLDHAYYIRLSAELTFCLRGETRRQLMSLWNWQISYILGSYFHKNNIMDNSWKTKLPPLWKTEKCPGKRNIAKSKISYQREFPQLFNPLTNNYLNTHTLTHLLHLGKKMWILIGIIW